MIGTCYNATSQYTVNPIASIDPIVLFDVDPHFSKTCNVNGRHHYNGNYCPVCAFVDMVIPKGSDRSVQIYGYYVDKYSRLLVRCNWGHYFYTSEYMSKNITACVNILQHETTVHTFQDNLINHPINKSTNKSVDRWGHQNSIKIKRLVSLILYYISRDSTSMKNLSTRMSSASLSNNVNKMIVKWQDDSCPAGHVVACNHNLKYVVMYNHDVVYVSDNNKITIKNWCRDNNYNLIIVTTTVSRIDTRNNRNQATKNVVSQLTNGFLKAGILKSYRRDINLFLDIFIDSVVTDFKNLSGMIISPKMTFLNV